MSSKYLPLGTLCELKHKNRKIMVIGYYSTEFDGNIKFSDYIGCVYPEGLLKLDQVCTFNHADIEKVISLGYVDDEQRNFNALLNRISGNDVDVIKDSHETDDMFLTSNQAYSKLLFDENGVVMISETIPKEEKEPVTQYEFDENGTVISISNKNSIKNPFHKDFEDVSTSKEVKYSDIIKDASKTETNQKDLETLNKIEFDEKGFIVNTPFTNKERKYVFDENGVVISDSDKTKSKYKFSENGVVISDSDKPKSKYKFSENGVVISDSDKPKSKYKFSENGVVISDSNKSNNKYKFDENGIVLEVNE